MDKQDIAEQAYKNGYNAGIEKLAKRLKERFEKSREYYEIDTGTAWGSGQIGARINDKIDETAKEINGGEKYAV